MAKKETGKTPRTLADFDTENLLIRDLTQDEDQEDEENENEETEDEEDEVEKDPEDEDEEEQPKKKVKDELKKPLKKKKEEEVIEEDEEVKPPASKKKPEVTEDEEEEEEKPEDFWKAVENITGLPVDVDFGDVDPISPQGVALREKALAEKAVDEFLNKLEESQPKVYKALEHALAGGDLEDLFTPGEKDYSKVVLKDDDEEHAKMILADFYTKKGLDPKRVNRMIANDEESEEGLVENAKGALEQMKTAQDREKNQVMAAQQAQAEKQKAMDAKMLASVDGIIGSGKIASFLIGSKNEAKEFADFVRQGLQRDGKGGYLFITPLDPTNLEKQLQAEYFKYKKGDLTKLISAKATTVNAEKLRLKLEKEKKTAKSTVVDTKKKQGRSMADFDVD